jgi:hypothetical protein
MGAARALLLRGLRLNAACAELWREYVRLEMGFVEAVRRRWDVLGISLGDDDDDDNRDHHDGQGERVDRAEEEAMGDAARRAIMGGAIVRQAIDSAGKGELSSFSRFSVPRVPTTNDGFLASSRRTQFSRLISHLISFFVFSLR